MRIIIPSSNVENTSETSDFAISLRDIMSIMRNLSAINSFFSASAPGQTGNRDFRHVGRIKRYPFNGIQQRRQDFFIVLQYDAETGKSADIHFLERPGKQFSFARIFISGSSFRIRRVQAAGQVFGLYQRGKYYFLGCRMR